MEKTTIIILISLIVLVLGVFFFGIRSTTKTIDNTFKQAKDELMNDTKYNSKVMMGGSKGKSIGVYSCLTTRNVFILLVGFFIGYIVSRF